MKRKLLCIVMSLTLCLGMLPGTAWAAVSDDEVQYRIDGGAWQSSSLIYAITAGEASTVSKSVEIELKRNITLTDESGWTSPVIGDNGDVSWTIDGKDYKITNGTTNQKVFTITGTTLTLQNITVDGGAVWSGEDFATRTNTGIAHPGNQHLAELSGGATLILESKAVLQNNDLSSWTGGYGAAVNIGADSTLIMKDGSAIRNNYAEACGGGVYMDEGSTFNMSGGSISENAVGLTASSWNTAYGGGGVYLSKNAKFKMTGGSITKNQMTKRYGGGVYVAYGATFTLTEGEISENTGNNGSGMGVYVLGAFEMSGGEIKNNRTPNSASSRGCGGGVYVRGARRQIGTFTMTGGSITENVAYSGGGVYVNDSYSQFNLSGGNITENQARWGGGIYLGSQSNIAISGSPVIANNANSDGTATNVYLNSNTTLTINSPLTLSVPIGVNVNETTAVKGGEPVTIANGSAERKFFSSDNPMYMISDAEDGSVQLVLRVPCKVMFNTNAAGDDVTAPTDQMTTDEGKLESLPEVTRDGYTFAGWFTEETGGVEVTTDTVFDKETTVYAHWALGSYTVTFLDPDSGSEIKRLVVKNGEKAEKPADPTKDGYDFVGWFMADGSGPFDFDTPITSNLELTAHWKEVPTHTVTFWGVSDPPATQTVRVGEKAKKPADPEREGYRFICWCTEDSSEPFDFENTIITEDVDLTAIWHQVFTVTFINKGGSVARQGVLYLRAVQKPNPDPTRTGYTFDGWFTDEDCTAAYDFSTPVTEDLTLYAKWLANYTVTFSGADVAAQTVAAGKTVAKPTNPTKEGYIFDGWFKDVSCTEAWDFDTDTVTENIILYAKWNETTVTGVTLDQNTLSLKEGETATLTATVSPSDTPDRSVTWNSSNTNAATVNSSGQVTAVSAGTATITASTANGHTAQCVVTVDHNWAAAWSWDGTHHWHECTAEGCGVTSNSGKDGYETHAYDNAQDTTCNICGYAWAVLPTPEPSDSNDTDDSEMFRLDMETNVFEIPKNLQGMYHTPQELETAMKTAVTQINAGIPRKNIAVYDVILMVSSDNGVTWTQATEDNFPAKGLKVTLPYPKGTDSSYIFTVVHMFTTGDKPGTTEVPPVTNTKNGIQFTVTGLSPISVGWTVPDASSTPSGSSSGGASTYAITVEKPEHGKVTSNRANASSNSTVTLTVIPDSGYVLDTLTVTDRRGNEIKLTAQNVGKYTFTMPSRTVTVKAVFAPLLDDLKKPCDGGADCPSRRFTDLGTVGTWYHEAVDYVLRNGLMNGYGSSLFGPDDNLSRAQLAQILYNNEGKPAVTGGSAFTDVADGQWYTSAITWAASNGIVAGYGNGQFGPDEGTTREQLAVMLWRYASSPAASEKELPFTDADQASGWALEALRWAASNGILNGYGDGRLDPGGPVTRAQAAQMLMNYLTEQ